MPTRVNAINSSKLLIAIGNDNSPETFTHPCMINTNRGIQFSSNPTETIVPYCPPDEDLASWIEREGDALTATITGAGIFDAAEDDFETFNDWYMVQESRHVHVILGALGYYDGYWLLTAFGVNGAGRRAKVEFDCTMLSDGPPTWHRTT